MSLPSVELRTLPFWPDDAPWPSMPAVPPPSARQRPDHEEPPIYDDLFGSTQNAMAFHASEVFPPPPAVESVPLQAAESVLPPAKPLPLETHPTLGTLRLSSGVVVSLDRGALLGRAPKVKGDATGSHGPHLLRLGSRQNDISRNHAEVVLRGRHVMVRDLGSTNGTTVALPGREPIRLRPNDLREIEPGMVVALADEVSFTIEVEA